MQTGDTDWVVTREWSYEKVKARMMDANHERQHIPIAHVQYNGTDHYKGWVTHSEPIEVSLTVHYSEVAVELSLLELLTPRSLMKS